MGCQISRKNDSDHPIDLVISADTMTNQYHDAEINYKARLEKKLCLVRLVVTRLSVETVFDILHLGKRDSRAWIWSFRMSIERRTIGSVCHVQSATKRETTAEWKQIANVERWWSLRRLVFVADTWFEMEQFTKITRKPFCFTEPTSTVYWIPVPTNFRSLNNCIFRNWWFHIINSNHYRRTSTICEI